MAIEAKNDAATYIDAAGNRADAQGVFLAAPGGNGPGGTPSNPFAISTPTSIVAVASVTRPNDTNQYAVGDLIANSTTAGSVIPLTFALARAADMPILARRLRLKVNDTAWKGATVRVHLFKDPPTVTVGDNGVLNNAETYAFSESNYLGYQDIVLAQQTSDGFAKGFAWVDFIAEPATGTVNISGLLEARTVVTPAASKIFSAVIEALRD